MAGYNLEISGNQKSIEEATESIRKILEEYKDKESHYVSQLKSEGRNLNIRIPLVCDEWFEPLVEF